jgi:hypothetical protein
VRERVTALVLFAVLAFYSATIGWRGVELVRDGRPAAVLLGIGVVLIPLVLLVALVPLLRMARDGSRMMAQLQRGEPARPGDEGWMGELEQAEVCRVAGDRAGEQRHYRAAVRAWRTARHGPAQRSGGQRGPRGS